MPTSAKELATVWSVTLELDALLGTAGGVGHLAGCGEDTVVTEEEVWKATATSFQDLPGDMDMEGARIDVECNWRQIMQNDH